MIAWDELRAQPTRAAAEERLRTGMRGPLTLAAAADLIGAPRAREIAPAGVGWHCAPTDDLHAAWLRRVTELALLRWESALRARIVADVVAQAEADLADRLAAAGVRAAGSPGTPAGRGMLLDALRRDY